MERKIKRGDIYYANLNPVIGSEQGGTRPVLIISNDVGNKHSPTVIVAPITSRIHTKAKLPTHTLINDFEGLDKNSIILLEQIRTIDKQRLKQYLGMIPDNIVARVDKALAISVALEKTKATDVEVQCIRTNTLGQIKTAHTKRFTIIFVVEISRSEDIIVIIKHR